MVSRRMWKGFEFAAYIKSEQPSKASPNQKPDVDAPGTTRIIVEGKEKSHASPPIHACSQTSSEPLSKSLPGTAPDTEHEHEHAAPAYAGFAKTDIKSRLPRRFLDRSRHLIITIFICQTILGICTGIMLNISGVGASGGAILILIPWVYSIVAALRRFIRVGKVVRALRKKGEEEEEFDDVTVSDSWERTTTRQGRTCYVHHVSRRAEWILPSHAVSV